MQGIFVRKRFVLCNLWFDPNRFPEIDGLAQVVPEIEDVGDACYRPLRSSTQTQARHRRKCYNVCSNSLNAKRVCGMSGRVAYTVFVR